jgi:hypothetical protein
MDFSQSAAYVPDKPQPRPYVQFITRPIEDRSVTSPDGVTKMKDVHFVLVRAPGAKDTLEKGAEDWLKQLEVYAKDERVPSTWPREYRIAFEEWKKTGELPSHGTPIKTWTPPSPAQRANILNAGVLTVEDLADANDEIRSRIGIGALNLQKMARRG